MIPLKDENPTTSVPFVTVGLIAANLFIFAYMLVAAAGEAERLVFRFSVIPSEFLGGGAYAQASGYLPLFSSMFLHGGLLHVGGNMLFLWIFGDNIEDSLGHVRFIFFYLACGVLAAMAHMLANPDSTLPMIGASGAVSGVLGAYIVLFPRARVWTFFFFLFFWQVIRVPAVIIIGLWILIQFLNGLASHGQVGGGVAWFAHVGGFAAGIALILFMGNKKMRRHARR